MGRVYGFVQLSGLMLKKKMETTGTPEKGQTFAPHEVGRRCNAAGEYPPNGIVNLVQTS
jgi:hypothetical protein